MKQAYVKGTYRRIVGVLEELLATAWISGFDDDGKPQYAGGSEVHWDSQRPVKRDGERRFICEDGDIVNESHVEFRDDDSNPDDESEA